MGRDQRRAERIGPDRAVDRDHHDHRPIFHDPSGVRQKWMRALTIAMSVAMVLTLALILGPLWMETRHPALLPQHRDVPLSFPSAKPASALPRSTAGWLPAVPVRPAASVKPMERFAFYMPWDEASRASLAAHARDIDWIVAGTASVTGHAHRFTTERDAHLHAILDRHSSSLRLFSMVQNADEDGAWDGAGTARLLASATARARLIAQIAAMMQSEGAQGALLDLENLPAGAHRDYLRFLDELRAAMAGKALRIALAVPVGDPAWDLAAYAARADHLFLMAYDQHWPGGEPGPIASQTWFAQVVDAAVRQVGRGKAVVAIGNYAYDWSGEGNADILTVREAWDRARQSGVLPQFDGASGNSGFAYRAGNGRRQLWMLDAASAWNQMQVARAVGASGIALWRLGSEDPSLWAAWTSPRGAQPDLSNIAADTSVRFDGAGEILDMQRAATPGQRHVQFDARNMVRSADMLRLPAPYLIRRIAGKADGVALTFDDGPDPKWTPQILDILKATGARATFFVTGRNALDHPDLLRRIAAEGHDIGNHSTTHPDLGNMPDAGVRLELSATRRLIEAHTGRSTRLFRAPLFGNAEPTTLDELIPTRIAAESGYLTVGLHVDPLDWQSPRANIIAAQTLAQVARGTPASPAQIVLLHDSGGDRSETVKALPAIIAALKARGHRLVTVSELSGLGRDRLMPPVTGIDQPISTAHGWLFGIIAGALRLFAGLFFLAIALGIARSLLLAALAWRNRQDGAPDAAPHLIPGFVTVLIPAFNEAKVIEASVRRILKSTGPRIEVIVIDDGSGDGTSDVVRAAFGIDPRVQLMTLENGGKARALNCGLARARGDVIVALDADTQFEPDAIAHLTRWFADPAIGAVAGVARVGNARNLVTRWQALEYITAQNLERRALAGLNAVTVVPGAIGAWRRSALADVGGYPAHTLAEDQDLTISIQRAGWRVVCDNRAVAWTEAPDSVHALMKQRFRWAFGTLQSLWKHRDIWTGVGTAKGLARIGLPQAWLFQIGFSLISPLIDLALLGAMATTAFRAANRGALAIGTEAMSILLSWIAFSAVDVGCAWLAYRLDGRGERLPLLRLMGQRIGYRQMMYWVVLRAIAAALAGPRVGWGKLERRGMDAMEPATAILPPSHPQASEDNERGAEQPAFDEAA